MKQVRLNRVEIWIADHALPIFGVVALAIIAGAIGITVVFLEAGEAKQQVEVLRPQVTRVNKAICDKQSLNHPQRAERCAERIRVGLINCRHSEPCRAAFLATITYPPPARGATSSPSSATKTTSPAPGDAEGGGAQQPSHGHQHPSPGSQPGQPSQEASPAPSPSSGPSAAPEPGPPAQTPGNGPQNGAGGGSSSGAGVEVCAAKACVGAEVNVPGL